MKQILFTIAAVCMSTTLAFAGDDCCGAKKKMPTEPVKQAKDDCASKCEGATKTVKAKGECGSKTVALSARIAKWQAGAAKGCKNSASKLASLKTACKTGCDKQMAAKVAALEANAAKGCPKSKELLASLEASVKPAPVAMSAKVKHWMAGAEKGCKSSKASLAVVGEQLNTKCMMTASKQIAELEAYAAKGCKKSAEKLASLEVALKASAKPAKKEKKAGFAKFRKEGEGCDGCTKTECETKCGDEASKKAKAAEGCGGCDKGVKKDVTKPDFK